MNLIGTSIFTHDTLSITVDNGIITKVDILESSSKKSIPFIAPGFLISKSMDIFLKTILLL